MYSKVRFVMKKEAKIMKLMELFNVLEKKSELVAGVIKLLDARETENFLGEEYRWIYNQFE
jgi:hypothetical protein